MAAVPPPPPAPPRAAAKIASLYVGDLDPEVTDSDLAQAFGAYGVIASVRICKDSQSGKSLGYGYVNFTDHSHASVAMASLNHTKLRGKSIRIMWSQRNPLPRKTGVGNLFVKNLDHAVNSTHLHTLFSKFGNVVSCKVAEENGRCKGFGYVQFDSQESAMAALSALHDTEFKGKKLHVSQFIKKSERTPASTEPKLTSLYVKNLTKDMTDDLLKDKFSEYGEVASATIMKDSEGKSRGFGFVNFTSAEAAMAAKEALNGTPFGSKNLFVGRAQNKAEREELLKVHFREAFNSQSMKSKDSNLYVKNLHVSIDDSKLHEHFSACGKITSAKVMRYDNGTSKGFGFVCFTTPEEAQKALATLNGTILQGQCLYVAKAQRKEDRCRELQKQHALSNPFPYPASQFSAFNINAPLFFPSYYPLQPIMYPSGVNVSVRYPLAGKYYQQNYSNSMATSKSWIRDANNGSFGVGSGGRAHLAARLPGNSKKSIHDALYPLVKNQQPEYAAKITGMLLEMNNSDLRKLINSPGSLGVQVAKAAQALKNESSADRVAASGASGASGKFARNLNY